jgi:hypothetical protein
MAEGVNVIKTKDQGDIRFEVAGNREMLRLCANGDIYVRGELADTDAAVVAGFKEWLRIAEADTHGPKPGCLN